MEIVQAAERPCDEDSILSTVDSFGYTHTQTTLHRFAGEYVRRVRAYAGDRPVTASMTAYRVEGVSCLILGYAPMRWSCCWIFVLVSERTALRSVNGTG
ncbi:hypothetical protein [Dongshaea marina]|uniref:hypothetical protein n=1 Tax=Dongshaea marina TaxID=2047966 RepID=UPI00131F3385|nr:hypothetical protein [Dongshaea marina]